MFSQSEGFISRTVEEIKDAMRLAVNAEIGSQYTPITFTDSSWDRIANVLAQVMCQGEQTMSAGWDNVRDYIEVLNQTLGKPISSMLGLLEYFNDTLLIGTNIKQPTEAEAGQIFLAFDLTPEELEANKLKIEATLIERNVLNYYFAGDTRWLSKLPNGQDWTFAAQLVEKLDTWIIINIIRSRQAVSIALDSEGVKDLFLKNLDERLRIGEDGEWGKVLNLNDIPWAGNVEIGYKDGEDIQTYTFEQKPVDYFQKILVNKNNIIVNIEDI